MRFKIFILLGVLSLLASAQSVTQTEAYRRWTQLPSDTLIAMGSEFAELQNKPDSGLICFTIAASRYKPEMSKQEKRSCAQGYIGKWFVYFFCYFDHSQAFENLLHAQEITQSIGEGVGRVYLNFGCTYQTLSEQSGDLRPDSLALDYYQKSYWQSKQEGDTVSLRMAMANMITVAYSLRNMGAIGRELADYRQIDKNSSATRFNTLLYQGLKHLQEGKLQEALNDFDQQDGLLKQDIGHTRYNYIIFANKARVYTQMGDYAHAIDMAKQAEQIANQIEMKDARLELYGMLGDLYAKAGNNERAEYYKNRYFQLKDSLLNYQQVAGVEELRFMGEMKRVDKQLQEMDHQRYVQSIVIKTVLGIAAIILLSMLIVWRKNRQLRQRNEMLYQKNVEMLEREEQYRAQRRELKLAEEQARHQVEEQARLLAEERAKNQPVEPASVPVEDVPEAEVHQKYKSSSLDEQTKQELMARIRDVMENAPEVYSPEFSAQQLATLAGAKYNYISQVINETIGKNFNAFVNEYRIIEACRRINDPQNFGHLTIEAVGNSVGFKSRTTFIQAFKKFTGLTPSEYQRIAREKTEK